MEAKRTGNDIIPKLGVIVTLLPFYSMMVNEWADLLWSLNRRSRKVFQDNQNLFYNLHKSVKCDQLDLMKELIKKYVDPDLLIDRFNSLYLN